MSVSVSVIIPSFNRAHLLPRAVDSVLAQSFSDWELIIVDDGSLDTTEELVAELCKKDTRIIGIRNEKNIGVSAARNLGARRAQGAWLAFLDSDDEWLPEKLQRQWQARQENSPLIHCDELWVRKGKRVNPKKKHGKSGGDIFQKCLELCCVSPSAAMVETKTYWSLGGFREDFKVCEDYDLWLKISARFVVTYIDAPLLVKYGGHSDQLSQAYKGMDLWRVKAIWDLIHSETLTAEQQTLAWRNLEEKLSILLKGSRKHSNLENYDGLFSWWQQSLAKQFAES